jgi:single-strand DNA-binding protein
MNLNLVLIAGNLTRDPESRTVGSSNVASFSIACNRRWKSKDGEDREEVTYVDCEAWGRTAEVICEHFTKGKPIFVEGRLKLDTWEKDGVKQSKLRVSVESFQFVGGRSNDDAPARRPTNRPAGRHTAVSEDDIPF